MARHHTRASMCVVSLGKVCKGRLHLRKERSKLVDQGKLLKETGLGVSLVSNSTFFNRDVGIMGLVIPKFGRQSIMSSVFVYLLLYFLVQLCFRVISCDVLYYLVHIVYIYF
jgi:hypothetical protein